MPRSSTFQAGAVDDGLDWLQKAENLGLSLELKPIQPFVDRQVTAKHVPKRFAKFVLYCLKL